MIAAAALLRSVYSYYLLNFPFWRSWPCHTSFDTKTTLSTQDERRTRLLPSAVEGSEGAKYGGDGNRTHVRIISNHKRYMLSLYSYFLIILKTGFNQKEKFRDTAQATQFLKPHLSVLSG